jgi:hypothetical protein
MSYDSYNPGDWGSKEPQLVKDFRLQFDDAKIHFDAVIKPRLDRSYKLYTSYNGDRALEIKKWQANVFVPYIHGVIETMMPRVVDARPDFTVQGRNADDQDKSDKLQVLGDYTWEIAEMDKKNEDVCRAAMVYGTGYLQVYWKKDVRTLSFLDTKDISKKKYKFTEKEVVFYDAPYTEWVDNYSLLYDWHNIEAEGKQYWFKRLLLNGAQIKRKYPNADPERLRLALLSGRGNVIDYASIRSETKTTHLGTTRNAERGNSSTNFSIGGDRTNTSVDDDHELYEVIEWFRPLEDQFAVMVNDVPILKKGVIPFPLDFKETPFIAIPYLRLPGEFEGVGLPLILENPQLMLNMMKNQRLDATTLNIHKMWIVNPLANINKNDLVTRPFGIIWSPDPNGVKEVQFSDVKQSAFQEERLLKEDMKYASGVDDFSMGQGGSASSATEVRHLRESTLERVRLFVNHLGDGYATMLRYWISLWRQFGDKELVIRILGKDGELLFPIIEKDDLNGSFDFKASVLPSIAGQNEVEKKQNMDLFQLLAQMEFVDQKKLISRVIQPWRWTLNSIIKEEQPQQQPMMGPDGQPMMGPDGQPMMDPGEGEGPTPPSLSGGLQAPPQVPRSISPDMMAQLLGTPPAGGASPFAEAANPINLLQAGALPPTPKGAPKLPTSNPRGLNRKPGGKVNTNLKTNQNYTPEGQIANRAINIQR